MSYEADTLAGIARFCEREGQPHSALRPVRADVGDDMRRYLLRIRPGRAEWPIVVEGVTRRQWCSAWPRNHRSIRYVVEMPCVGGKARSEAAHYRKAEVGLLELARQVAKANPSLWVDVLDVTEPAAVNEAYRIVCRIEPRALAAEPVQDALL